MLIPFSEIVSNCTIATIKIILFCLGGFSLARMGVLSDSQIRAMSKVSQDVFIPCLIFSNFINVSSSQIILYSPVVIIATATIFFGIYIGKLLSKHVIKQEKYSVMFQVLCGFPHTLNIQLSMTETLAPLLDKIDLLTQQVYAIPAELRGVIFTMITTIVNTIVRWSLMTKLIKENEKDSTNVSGSGATLEMRLLNTKGREIKPNELANQQELTTLQLFWKNFQEIMNPPLFMTSVAIIIAMIPPLQYYFIAESSLVYQLVTRSLKFLGGASSPVLLVLLGSNFGQSAAKGEKPSAFAVGCLTATKMVFMPIFGFFVLLLLQWLSVMTDPTMIMITLVTFAAPTANNILIQYASLGKEMGTISKMVLATYLCSIVTLPLTLVAFFSTWTVE